MPSGISLSQRWGRTARRASAAALAASVVWGVWGHWGLFSVTNLMPFFLRAQDDDSAGGVPVRREEKKEARSETVKYLSSGFADCYRWRAGICVFIEKSAF